MTVVDQLGTIAAGKSADFIVLNANPLDNIANTRKINRVYLRGQDIARAAMRAKWQAEPDAAPGSDRPRALPPTFPADDTGVISPGGCAPFHHSGPRCPAVRFQSRGRR
jgi:adenine deaminase